MTRLMDPAKRNTESLIKDIKRYEAQLFKRYQNIIELAASSTSTSSTTTPQHDATQNPNAIADRNAAAYNTLRMEIETAAVVRTCEDILSLSRQLKELWLFGKLNTLRSDHEFGQIHVEEDARVVGGLVEELLRRSGGKGVKDVED